MKDITKEIRQEFLGSLKSGELSDPLKQSEFSLIKYMPSFVKNFVYTKFVNIMHFYEFENLQDIRENLYVASLIPENRILPRLIISTGDFRAIPRILNDWETQLTDYSGELFVRIPNSSSKYKPKDNKMFRDIVGQEKCDEMLSLFKSQTPLGNFQLISFIGPRDSYVDYFLGDAEPDIRGYSADMINPANPDKISPDFPTTKPKSLIDILKKHYALKGKI